MANIITTLKDRIAGYYSMNKNPCRHYATEKAAEAAAQKMAKDAAEYFCGNGAEPADYVVFLFEPMNRWVFCIHLTEVMRRSECRGGYVGFCKNVFTF